MNCAFFCFHHTGIAFMNMPTSGIEATMLQHVSKELGGRWSGGWGHAVCRGRRVQQGARAVHG